MKTKCTLHLIGSLQHGYHIDVHLRDVNGWNQITRLASAKTAEAAFKAGARAFADLQKQLAKTIVRNGKLAP